MNPNHLYSTHTQNNTSIFLTGFGRFGNHQVNPTELLVTKITPEEKIKFGIQEAKVLDVSVRKVDEWIQKTAAKVNQISKTKPVWMVHLGVGNNTVYHLEQLAYNNKYFWSPDNDGYCCQNEPICQQLKIEHQLRCKTDLSHACKDLKKCHNILVSQDPGRYLCNYIYFKSLNELSAKNPRINSVFVHIPTSQYTTVQENKEFVLNFISWLHKSTVCNEVQCKLK